MKGAAWADAAAAVLKGADALIFSAGAGMGVDSGLPDFRGNAGFWRAYPELGRQKTDFTAIANPAAFRRDPELAWGFYGHRLKLYRETVPHQGFAALLTLAEELALPYFVFTSNVDGQFQKAGFDPDRIYECHGSIHHLQCSRPCCGEVWPAEGVRPQIDEAHCRWLGALPACIHCGALARPNILMFGDVDWVGRRSDAQAARLQAFLQAHRRIAVLETGAGLAVPTVRRFGERFAPRLIRINPRDDALPAGGGLALKTGAREGIARVLACVQAA